MQRVEIHLKDEERDYLEILSSTGVCQSVRCSIWSALEFGELANGISRVDSKRRYMTKPDPVAPDNTMPKLKLRLSL
jgi:hypothetical protein